MTDNTQMVTSPLSQELYSIDWAVRFDEFRKYDQSSYTDIHQLLGKIKDIVESEFSDNDSDLNDRKALATKLNKAKPESVEWHRLSILVHSKIIKAAMHKGLTATATLSAIQIMESMWKIADHQNKSTASVQKTSKPAEAAKPATKKPAVKAVQNPTPRKKPKTAPVKKTANKPTANNTDNRKPAAKTENVVIKKLAAEAGLDDDKVLEAKCYEIASSLAEEYPEYTLTAIRVMTAEKLGVTRQFVENLDIKPARFKNG